jgi:hypothetical protein
MGIIIQNSDVAQAWDDTQKERGANAVGVSGDFMAKLSEKKGVQKFWEDVDAIIRLLDAKFPDEMTKLDDSVKEDRTTLYNDFGSNADKTIRLKGRIPMRLTLAQDRIYNKEYPVPPAQFGNQFFKRYPRFQIARRI